MNSGYKSKLIRLVKPVAFLVTSHPNGPHLLKMFIDAHQIPEGQSLEAEICIIGGGAAGITIAKSLGHEARVILLESGGQEFDKETHELTRALSMGRPYDLSAVSRLRYFGGSTNRWGGHCAPMRPVNFETSPSIPYSGWPFGYDELHPYYLRAHDMLDLGPFRYDADYVSRLLNLPLFPLDPARVETVISRYNTKRFGPDFRDELDRAANVKVVLYANVTLIDRDSVNPTVNRVAVATLDGKAFEVVARIFVLAAGGIENARLLLHSRNVETTGLGNGHDLVGRFFMEHIWYQCSTIVPFDEAALYKIYGSEIPLSEHEGLDLPYRIRAHLALPEDVVRREQIPDFRAEIRIGFSLSRSDIVLPAEKLYADLKQMGWPNDFLNHLANIAYDPASILARLTRAEQMGYAYILLNNFEQTPNPNSRIRLSEERDVLDMPLAVVEWRLTDLDKYGIRRAHELIAAEVDRAGFGRFRMEIEDAEEVLLVGASGISHHMGTTRMHNDPHLGVVDANAKVHGLANFFVAGSSVYPTAGYINPTLTITALALRLADHLRDRMARPPRETTPLGCGREEGLTGRHLL